MARVFFLYFDLHTGYYPSFHHGLASIIGSLKKENHNVSLLHLIDEDDFNVAGDLLGEVKLDCIGFSFSTNQKKYVRKFLDTVELSAKLIIAGGVHSTLVKDEIFKNYPQFDGVCIGEGEIPLIELCRRLDSKEDYLNIPSFYFKTKDKIIKNPISPLPAIELLAFPDYSLFDYKKIIDDNSGYFPMMLSRGCPYSCNYCCNHVFRNTYPQKNKYVRFLPVSHSIELIKHNLSLYPEAQKIAFADDVFTLNKRWLFEFCNVYKKEINLPFLCNARVETINEDVVRILKDAGCASIDFGVETGNEWLRKNILNRHHSNNKIIKAFDLAEKYGIRRFSFNITGLPLETKNMAEETVSLNMRLRPNFGKCFYFFPYPGTKLYQMCLDFGLLLDDIEQLSGYLEGPSLKEIFMTHENMRKTLEFMQFYFMVRLVFSKIKMPYWMERILVKKLFMLRVPYKICANPLKRSSLFTGIRKLLRKFALKYLR